MVDAAQGMMDTTMKDFKEFQGKSLDDAIQKACIHFDTKRDNLEIDIVQDAKNGIFGLVGARKAIVRARKTQLASRVTSLIATKKNNRPERSGNRVFPEAEPVPDDIGNRLILEELPDDTIGNRIQTEEEIDDSIGNRIDPESSRLHYPTPRENEKRSFKQRSDRRPQRQERKPRFQRQRPAGFTMDQPERQMAPSMDQDENLAEGLPATPFSELDHNVLSTTVQEVATKIVSSILGDKTVAVTILENRVDIQVDCDEDSGLLIGREGQTLNALQYITSRIVSRIMQAPVRVQYNIGDYRERQDDRIREIALGLAERARNTGRPYSTRPMSSYHRRLVHLALQEAPDILTRSSGEGPLKRVIIQPRRSERNGRC